MKQAIRIIYIDDEDTAFFPLASACKNFFSIESDLSSPQKENGVVTYHLGSNILQCVKNSSKALELIKKTPFDIAFIDFKLSEEEGSDVGKLIYTQHTKIYQRVIYQIMLTAYKEVMIDTLRTGVFRDFINKPLDDKEGKEFSKLFARFEAFCTLENERRNAVKRAEKAEKKLATLNWDVSKYTDDKSSLKGNSMAMCHIRKFIDIYSNMNTPVLLLGETGTGKDVVAEEIHNCGRKGKTYLQVNCAALPESLLESTLFGHTKNAFTGADDKKDKKGYFELAKDGTLFLDEFGDLSSSAQNKILRVIENGDFIPVGSEVVKKTENVRVICATSRKLLMEDENNSFRKDLLFRLSSFFPEIPPLRERKEDIGRILAYYRLTEKLDGITPEVIKFLSECDYDWPGNVRELLNFTRQSIALMVNQKLDTEKLSTLLEIWKERQPKPSEKIEQVFRTNKSHTNNLQKSQGDMEPKEYEIKSLKELLYNFLKVYERLEKEENRKPTVKEIEPILKPQNKEGWLAQYFTTKEVNGDHIRYIINSTPELCRLKLIPPIKKFFSK